VSSRTQNRNCCSQADGVKLVCFVWLGPFHGAIAVSSLLRVVVVVVVVVVDIDAQAARDSTACDIW